MMDNLAGWSAPSTPYWGLLRPEDFLYDHSIFLWLVLVITVLLALELVSRIPDGKTKHWTLATAGAGLLGWLDIASLFILISLALLVFLMVRRQVNVTRYLYWWVLALIALLIFIKKNVFGLGWEQAYIPLGVSYYFFRLISFLIEYGRGRPEYCKLEISRYFCWVFFFPTFLAGPILRYHDFRSVAREVQVSLKLRNYFFLCLALVLKFFIVDHYLAKLVYSELIMAMGPQGSMGLLSLFGFLALLHAYLDLMLYTEMSKAIAGYLGYTNVENFNRPLLATNISQFWLRWHISLSDWTKDYIFFPTLIKTRKVWLSSYASMMIIGLWHDCSANWILWALLHGSFINLYNLIKQSRLYVLLIKFKSGRLFLGISGWLVTIYFVSMVFIFVAFDNLRTPLSLWVWCMRSSWEPVAWLLNAMREWDVYQFAKQLLGV